MIVLVIFVLGCLYTVSGDFLIENSDFGVRIIGGSSTTLEKHPWQISLQLYGKHVCGGAIISHDAILTAAHCVPKFIPIEKFSIIVGETDLRKAKMGIQLRSKIHHDLYNGSFYYDIAMLKLKEDLTFSEKIQPINLPSESFTVPKGATLKATGWSVTKYGNMAYVLRELEMLRGPCGMDLGKMGESVVCAEIGKRRGDCQTDTGGPLEFNGTLVGILFVGQQCGVPDDKIGWYANVSYYRSWIKEKAGI